MVGQKTEAGDIVFIGTGRSGELGTVVSVERELRDRLGAHVGKRSTRRAANVRRIVDVPKDF